MKHVRPTQRVALTWRGLISRGPRSSWGLCRQPNGRFQSFRGRRQGALALGAEFANNCLLTVEIDRENNQISILGLLCERVDDRLLSLAGWAPSRRDVDENGLPLVFAAAKLLASNVLRSA